MFIILNYMVTESYYFVIIDYKITFDWRKKEYLWIYSLEILK